MSSDVQIIMVSEEALDISEFNAWSINPVVRRRWATTVVDKAHLVDGWAKVYLSIVHCNSQGMGSEGARGGER
jgi:hypothetical protein